LARSVGDAATGEVPRARTTLCGLELFIRRSTTGCRTPAEARLWIPPGP